jgi:hypothetical protein
MSVSDMRVMQVPNIALLIRATLQRVARMSASDMRGDRHQSKDVDARDKPGHDGWLLVETLVPDIALLIRATIPPRLEEDRSPFPTAGTALRPLASPRSAD